MASPRGAQGIMNAASVREGLGARSESVHDGDSLHTRAEVGLPARQSPGRTIDVLDHKGGVRGFEDTGGGVHQGNFSDVGRGLMHETCGSGSAGSGMGRLGR